ncbi:hypothetical protein N9A28_03815 [Sulfurimonas sp.]|nr:hypothetical protein [Sulfurimonas sp.]
MEHVYLTKKDIDRAVEMKQITNSERDELLTRIEYDSKIQRRTKSSRVSNSVTSRRSTPHRA